MPYAAVLFDLFDTLVRVDRERMPEIQINGRPVRTSAGMLHAILKTQAPHIGLEEIQKLGGEPKDLGLGLVDFPHLRRGEEVNLCWKYGEREVRHWHGLDEGYTGRKPL